MTASVLCRCGRLALPCTRALQRLRAAAQPRTHSTACAPGAGTSSCRRRYAHEWGQRPLGLSRQCTVASATAQQQPVAGAAPPAGGGSPQQDSPEPSFRANLDLKYVREHVDELVENCARRNSSADPRLVARLYDDYVALNREADALRKERNDNAAAMKGKMEADRRQALVEQGKALKQQSADLEVRLQQLENQLQIEAQRLPNLTHPDSPVGEEGEAAELDIIGEQRHMDFEVQDHVQLGTSLGLIDFEAGAAVSGTKFVYLRGAGALLEVALVSWAMQRVSAAGFMPHGTPDLVRATVLEKCGFQPRGDNTQVYSIEDSPLCLTGTAEVPLAGLHMDAILPAAALPLRLAAFGRAFRTEAGAAGSASRGLYRLHQFSKVEMFVICTPEQSDAMLQELVSLEKQLFSELGLHFKVLDMPTGDLGAPAYRKIDFEAWMAGMQRYGEISSASNCTDYQARRLGIRFRPQPPASEGNGADGKPSKKQKKVPTQYVHTLNATAAAIPRLIVAILETHQQADGSVRIPEALQPFMGGQSVISPEDARLLPSA